MRLMAVTRDIAGAATLRKDEDYIIVATPPLMPLLPSARATPAVPLFRAIYRGYFRHLRGIFAKAFIWIRAQLP